MKKRVFSLLLTMVMVMSLLPAAAIAAETNPPDWNFLVIFAPMDADYEENNVTKHVKTSISEEERSSLVGQLVEFESVMLESGVMTPHFTKLAISTPITKLGASSVGPYPDIEVISAYLKDHDIALDTYDHVIVYARMDNVSRGYGGITPRATFDNGTTYSFIPADYCLRNWGATPKRPAYVVLHEFLHTMELTCGYSFDLHAIEADIVPGYQSDEKYKACMMDIILNRIVGQHGSGVRPSAWLHSLRTLRTFREFTIPNDMTIIGSYQFKNHVNLESIIIPSTVTGIKDHAFQFCSKLSRVTLPTSISSIEEGTFEQCSALTEIAIPSGVTSIGTWAFESCGALRKITIPTSVASIEAVAFQNTGLTDVYYEGTEKQWKAIRIGGYNAPLTSAVIHYNSTMPASPSTPVKFRDVSRNDWFYDPVQWAVEREITSGTGTTTFSPGSTCTQGQILTFLWRANGSPKPAGTVRGNEYYAAALQWAKEQRVTNGIAAAAALCTRADVVTYLWRLAGSPRMDALASPMWLPDAPYAQAVAWAVGQGITSGTSAVAFSPDSTCTRGQIVTFLYRALQNNRYISSYRG